MTWLLVILLFAPGSDPAVDEAVIARVARVFPTLALCEAERAHLARQQRRAVIWCQRAS